MKLSRRRPASPSGLNVLVTGAGSGIGRSVAELLGRRGARLYLTDRNPEAVNATAESVRGAGGVVELVQAADVSSADDVAALGVAVHDRIPALDAVLNVAGIAIWGKVEDLELDHWRRAIDVNLMGPIHVVHTFVPPMIAAGTKGHLVNVASAAALVGLPLHAPYSASKFGLRGVSEVLRFDLARHGIAVTLVCPGGVDTPLTGTVEVVGYDTTNPAFERLRGRFQRHAVSSEVAATHIVEGMLARRYLVFTSGDTRAIHAVQRLAPPVYNLAMRGLSRYVERTIGQAA